MAVSTTHSRVTYTSDGATLAYATTFVFFAAGDFLVTHGPNGTETTLSLGTGYTVTGGVDADGLPGLGTVTLVAPVTNGHKIRIQRQLSKTQPLDFPGALSPNAFERGLDRLTLIVQEIVDGVISSEVSHGIQAGGNLHADVVRNGNSGFMNGTTLDTILDHVEVVAGNPHGSTVAQVGATPAAHKGAGGTAEHPIVTASDAGFMDPTHLSKLNGIPAGADPLLTVKDDFYGSVVDTGRWQTMTAGGGGTATVRTADDAEYGVFELLTAATINSEVGLWSTARWAKSNRSPTYKSRLSVGDVGGVANSTASFGLTDDYSTPAHFARFRWDGSDFFAESAAGGATQSTPITDLVAGMKRYEIRVTASDVKFYVDDVLVATHATVPANTKPLGDFMRVLALNGAAHSLRPDFSRIDVPSRVYT